MKAYSYRSGKEYESWEDLVADPELANGWVVLVLLRKRKDDYTYARCYGPWPTKKQAHNKAQTIRKKFKKDIEEHPGIELLGFRIEPAWTGVE
jgi:hypothetical protein